MLEILVAVLALGGGVLLTLSMLERRVWGLMRGADAARVSDQDAREVDSALQLVVAVLPKVMAVALTAGVAVALWQAIDRGFDWQASTVLVVLVVGFAVTGSRVPPLVAAMKAAETRGDVALRTRVGQVVLVHHVGLTTCVATLALQLVLVVGLG